MTERSLPNNPTVIVSDDPMRANWLACPLCDETGGSHLDAVQIAARQEDQDFINIEVSTVSGDITHPSLVPVGSEVGEGRRDRIALAGWCEVCGGKFALVFTQHKGVTFVEWVHR